MPQARYPEHLQHLLRDIGTRVAEIRRRRQWTQKQAAERIPMNLVQFRQLEQGRANLRIGTLDRVATAFRVPIASLLRKPRAR
jgi:transcriptional regulator with XRE-family HTH domain